MRFMVNSVPDASIQRVGKVLDDTKKAKSAIASSFAENPVIFLILLVWILLAGLLVFLVGLHLVCRLLYTRKSKPVSGQKMVFAALAFAVCVITSFIGLIFYSASLDQLRDGIVLIPQQVNTTTSDVSKFMTYLNESVQCIRDQEGGHLRSKIDDAFESIAREVDGIRDILGANNLGKILVVLARLISETADIGRKKSQLSVQMVQDFRLPAIEQLNKVVMTLLKNLREINGNVQHTDNMLDQGLKKLEEDKEKAFVAVEEYEETLSGVLIFVNESTIRIQEEIANVISEKDSIQLSEFLGYTLYIPVILVALSIVGLAGIMGGWKFRMGSDRFDTRRSRRGALTVTAASALASAGYTSLIVGAMLCLMSAFCFLVAFGAMMVCMGLFKDDDLRLFHAIPNLQYHAKFGKQEVSYSLYNTFYKCKNGYPFFESINGSDIMAQKELDQQFSQSRRHALARQIQNFHVDPELIRLINSQIPKFAALAKQIRDPYAKNRQSHGKSPNLKEILDDIGNVIKLADNVLPDLKSSMANITNMASPESRDEIFNSLSLQVLLLHSSFSAAFADIFHRAVNISPKCRTLMRIWDGLGGYVCDWISAPAQGLWVACMVCALGSSAIYHAFFNTARFLHEYAESTREAFLRKKRRHKKLDYVHRKLGEHGGTPKDDAAEEMSHSQQGSTTNAAAATAPSNDAVPEKKDPSTPTANKPTDGSERSEKAAAKRSESKEATPNVSKENTSKETLTNTSKGTTSHEEKAPE